MSVKSKRPSGSKGKHKELPIDRPFDPVILRKARQIADQYKLILEPEPELGFVGCSVEMPYVFDDGKTPDDCVAKVREALTTAVATLLERGERPPLPVSEGRRESQVNIRLSAEEKFIVEESARRQGFRGLSDFVRAAALAQATGQSESRKNGR